jgi:hypothetical protein
MIRHLLCLNLGIVMVLLTGTRRVSREVQDRWEELRPGRQCKDQPHQSREPVEESLQHPRDQKANLCRVKWQTIVIEVRIFGLRP